MVPGAHGWLRAARIGSSARLTQSVGRTWSGSSSRGGGPKYCWCMVWRAMPGSRRGDAGAKKEALAQRVQSGAPVGILGYRDGEPAAWCSVAPRPTYCDLGGAPDVAGLADRVWSVVCFFVARSSRGEGRGTVSSRRR